jgi:anti-anti-sigma factor
MRSSGRGSDGGGVPKDRQSRQTSSWPSSSASIASVNPSISLDRLQPQLDRLMAGVRHDVLVLDLRGVAFIDSVGLSLLVEAHEAALGGEFRLAIVRGPREVQRIFELAGTKASRQVASITGSAFAGNLTAPRAGLSAARLDELIEPLEIALHGTQRVASRP